MKIIEIHAPAPGPTTYAAPSLAQTTTAMSEDGTGAIRTASGVSMGGSGTGDDIYVAIHHVAQNADQPSDVTLGGTSLGSPVASFNSAGDGWIGIYKGNSPAGSTADVVADMGVDIFNRDCYCAVWRATNSQVINTDNTETTGDLTLSLTVNTSSGDDALGYLGRRDTTDNWSSWTAGTTGFTLGGGGRQQPFTGISLASGTPLSCDFDTTDGDSADDTIGTIVTIRSL